MSALDTAGVFAVEQWKLGIWEPRTTKETLRAACYAASYFSREFVGPAQVREGEVIHATYRKGHRTQYTRATRCVECRTRWRQPPGQHCRRCARALGLLPPVGFQPRVVPAKPDLPRAPIPASVQRLVEVVVPGQGRRVFEVCWDGTQGGSLERFMNPAGPG